MYNVLADGHGSTNGHIVSMARAHTPSSSRYLGPAQRRYGDYFLTVLASPDLAEPEGLTKVLRQVQLTVGSVCGLGWRRAGPAIPCTEPAIEARQVVSHS